MNGDFDNKGDAAIREIGEALRQAGEAALKGRSAEDAAREWLAAGFDDAEEVEEWLAARCFDARVAETLEAAGLTPAQAGLRTAEGRGRHEETIACKVANGDLSLDEARRIITREFWQK